jgi:hypothetical protein
MSRALVFLLAVVQAPAIVSLAVAPTAICPERCPDDETDGRCPPACASCPASTHTVAPVLAAAPVAPAVVRQPVAAVASRSPAEPEPRDIFHVPKRLLA